MRHIAVIGSGPAGYYSAEALQKHYGDEVRIDMIDRMPVPYGLIRFGVAPDHQSIKAVSQALREGRALRQCPLRRQCAGRPRRLDPRAGSRSTTRSSSPPARPTTGRSTSPAATCPAWSARPRSSAGITAIPNSPTSIRRSTSRRGGDRQRQCRARRRPHPLQDAGRVRRLGHRRPRLRARSATARSATSTCSAGAGRTRSR